MKIDWKKKLTSRKLWMAIAGLVTGIVLLVTGSGSIEGVVMALGSVVAYIVGEGLADAANTPFIEIEETKGEPKPEE